MTIRGQWKGRGLRLDGSCPIIVLHGAVGGKRGERGRTGHGLGERNLSMEGTREDQSVVLLTYQVRCDMNRRRGSCRAVKDVGVWTNGWVEGNQQGNGKW